MLSGLQGLSTGLSVGLNSLGAETASGVPFPSSGTAMATQMGFANSPDMLTRLNGTSGLPDLAGGDDPFTAYNAGIATTTDATLGVCADRADNSQYYTRYSSNAQFDLTTESFAFNVVMRYHQPPTTRYLLGKFGGGAGWLLVVNNGSLAFNIYGSSTIGRSVAGLADDSVLVITGVCDRNANTMALHVNGATSGTIAPPGGSLTNTGLFSFGGLIAAVRTPECQVAQIAFWQGAGAEGMTQTHHNNFISALGL